MHFAGFVVDLVVAHCWCNMLFLRPYSVVGHDLATCHLGAVGRAGTVDII